MWELQGDGCWVWTGSGTDAHAPFHTLILITLDVFATFRELREDCGVDLGRVKHLQRLEAKRGTITAFFAKQVIPPCPSLPPLYSRQQAACHHYLAH